MPEWKTPNLPGAAERAEKAVQMMLKEAEGQPYDVRRRFSVLLPTLRGHRIEAENIQEGPTGLVGQCSICEQVVKVPLDGTSIEGRAIENDCPAAPWRRPP